MASEIPPYQLQELIAEVFSDVPHTTVQGIQIKCAQALGIQTPVILADKPNLASGSELYVGCSNGELMRFAVQADDPRVESYTILSRQSLPNDKPVEEIALLPSISRALVLSDNQIHFYTLPSLDVVTGIKPIRHVVTFAVDQRFLSRSPSSGHQKTEPDIPLPQGATLARRFGSNLCFSDKVNYNMLNLETAEMLPCMPFNQDFDSPNLPVEPFIVSTGEDDFLLVSWTGQSSLGIFLSTSGDPVRGTVTWAQHPISICLDLPQVIAILPNGSVEIHNIDTQSLVQVIPPPSGNGPMDRVRLVSALSGYVVPSTQGASQIQKVPIKLRRGPSAQP
ncbi:hypothetical protein D9757_004156 [Collybiopsis confluens]|uniref:CNH domain-containing protein n=1 Tax=Collybiopsis confluens TaxID=2823264 RepID=A0A8H5HUN2_9AGAR|nr:hypothetical protein D9757_004156 [Collybiopsis confluens]